MHNWSLFLLYMFIAKIVKRFQLTLVLGNITLKFAKQFSFCVHLIQIQIQLFMKHKFKFMSFSHMTDHTKLSVSQNIHLINIQRI